MTQNPSLLSGKRDKAVTPVAVRGTVATSDTAGNSSAAVTAAETRETNQLLCEMIVELKKINFQLEDMRL